MNLQPVVDLQLIPSIDDTLGVGDNNASFLIASIWKAEAEVSLRPEAFTWVAICNNLLAMDNIRRWKESNSWCLPAISEGCGVVHSFFVSRFYTWQAWKKILSCFGCLREPFHLFSKLELQYWEGRALMVPSFVVLVERSSVLREQSGMSSSGCLYRNWKSCDHMGPCA